MCNEGTYSQSASQSLHPSFRSGKFPDDGPTEVRISGIQR